LLTLAFDVVLAGCWLPLTLGLYWKKANATGAIVGFICGSTARIILYFVIPEDLAGLDTLLAPVFSLVMIPVCLMTQESDPPKHHINDEIPDDEAVLAGLA
jgi:Na+(H+)/acetate symporter ActP